jgi:transcriptional regulator with XRE-family HTH domain
LVHEALGDLVGFNAMYVSRIERGVQNVGLKTIQKLAKALKTSPEKIFKGVR